MQIQTSCLTWAHLHTKITHIHASGVWQLDQDYTEQCRYFTTLSDSLLRKVLFLGGKKSFWKKNIFKWIFKPVTLFCTRSTSVVDDRDCRIDPGTDRMVSFEQSIQKRWKKRIYLLIITPPPSLRTIIWKETRKKARLVFVLSTKGKKW